MPDRAQIANLIVARLEPAIDQIAAEFQTPGRIRSCQIQDLLPPALARQIHDLFPASERMVLKRSIKENKHAAAQMDVYGPLHATSFRGEPGQVSTDLVMRADNALRTTVLKMLGEKVWTNPHVYHRDR